MKSPAGKTTGRYDVCDDKPPSGAATLYARAEGQDGLTAARTSVRRTLDMAPRSGSGGVHGARRIRCDTPRLGSLSPRPSSGRPTAPGGIGGCRHGAASGYQSRPWPRRLHHVPCPSSIDSGIRATAHRRESPREASDLRALLIICVTLRASTILPRWPRAIAVGNRSRELFAGGCPETGWPHRTGRRQAQLHRPELAAATSAAQHPICTSPSTNTLGTSPAPQLALGDCSSRSRWPAATSAQWSELRCCEILPCGTALEERRVHPCAVPLRLDSPGYVCGSRDSAGDSQGPGSGALVTWQGYPGSPSIPGCAG